jgi:hypothetical protein
VSGKFEILFKRYRLSEFITESPSNSRLLNLRRAKHHVFIICITISLNVFSVKMIQQGGRSKRRLKRAEINYVLM